MTSGDIALVIAATITAIPATVAAMFGIRTHHEIRTPGVGTLGEQVERHIRLDDSRYVVTTSLVAILTDPTVSDTQKKYAIDAMLKRAEALMDWNGTERRKGDK